MKSKRLLVAIGVVVVVAVVVVAGGAFAYFFSGLRSSPKPLSVTSPSTKASATASATTGSEELTGDWTISAGSVAGYRVREQFVGQSSPHEAVARTSDVSGELSVTEARSGLQASSLHFAVQLANLHSVDSVAGFDVTNRDRTVARTLDVQQYPQAVFEAGSVDLPPSLSSGRSTTVNVPGQLTLHGVTRQVTATVQIQVSEGHATVAGLIPIVMTDFGITPPQVPFTQVESAATIEFSVDLTRD